MPLDRRNVALRDAISWLSLEDRIDEDSLYRLCQKRQPGTCEWIFKNSRFLTWTGDEEENPIIWLKGIPGAGQQLVPCLDNTLIEYR